MERTLKAAALAAGVVGLLVLVAMAARGGHPGTNGHVATRAVPNSVQDAFITLLAIAYIGVIVAIIVGVFRYRDRWHDPGSRWLQNFVLVLVLMGIASAVGYYAMTHSNLRQTAEKVQRAQGRSGNGQNRIRHVPATPARQAHFEWPLALGVGGLLLLGGVWVYVRGRRARLSALPGMSLEADIVETIETTVDDLRREPDARKAVIAAYAHMERTLRQHGFARHRAEAPFEYLTRILRQLNVRDSAVRTLTDLFEYAKFSRHPVDEAMKEQAIEALLAVRDDLQAAQAVAA